jgi:hypothetical protein
VLLIFKQCFFKFDKKKRNCFNIEFSKIFNILSIQKKNKHNNLVLFFRFM